MAKNPATVLPFVPGKARVITRNWELHTSTLSFSILWAEINLKRKWKICTRKWRCEKDKVECAKKNESLEYS